MLKIKDNVDLKELEKYGFYSLYSDLTGNLLYMFTIEKYGDICQQRGPITTQEIDEGFLIYTKEFVKSLGEFATQNDEYLKCVKEGKCNFEKALILNRIELHHRKILYHNKKDTTNRNDILYDLIKADLVEKVDEK